MILKPTLKISMAFKIIVTTPAQVDIANSIDYYESRQQNLGGRFYDDFIINTNYLISNPYLFPKSGNFHELKLTIFPYIIVYEIINYTVIIHAVFNTSKNPVKKP